MKGSTSLGWRTTMSREKMRAIQLDTWKQDACAAVDTTIEKWRAEEDLWLSGAAGRVRVPPCKASRGHYEQTDVHGSSLFCMKEQQQLVHELYVTKSKELAAQGDLHTTLSRIRVLEESLTTCPNCGSSGEVAVKDLYARIESLVEENKSVKCKLRDLRVQHSGIVEGLHRATEIKKKLYQVLGYL